MEEPVDAENEEDKTIHWCYIMIKKFEAELKTKDDLLEVEIEIMKKSLYEDLDSKQCVSNDSDSDDSEED